MPTKLTVVTMIVGAWLAATAVPLLAHHAFAAEFDAKKPVHFTGTVTKALSVIDRQEGATENLAARGIALHPLFTKQDFDI